MSAFSSGPSTANRRPKADLITLSTVSASQMPFSTRAMASRHNACCKRFPMKPGTSFLTCAGFLPAAACNFMTASIVCRIVHCVSITSTSGTRYGGFHQCLPSARSRRSSASMILLIGMNVAFDFGEQPLLERQVFQHGFDNVVGLANRLREVTDRRHAFDGFLVI